MDLIFSKIFLESYRTSLANGAGRCVNIEKAFKEESLIEVENALKGYIYAVLGYRINHNYNWGEVRIHIDNVCNNIRRNTSESLVELIDEYKNYYLDLMGKYPHVALLIDVFKNIFDKNYDGKLGSSVEYHQKSDNAEAIIRHNRTEHIISIEKAIRQSSTPLPSVFMHNLDNIEKSLTRFVDAVKNSNTNYNMFYRPGYSTYSEDEKIKILFEGVILNATSYDLIHLDEFFDRYTAFVSDEKMGELNKLACIGDAFEDKLYFKTKKSDFEYETPYCLAFMLANHRIELPNVRMGIADDRAYILALQTSQETGNKDEIDTLIKANIPRTKKFNFYNPTHMVSLTLAVGLLNGMGIKKIDISDYMPLRYYKTIKDKKMDESEADRYLTRVTEKYLNTFFKFECLTKGVNINCPQGSKTNITIDLDDEIICHNEFFQHLYELAYNYGRSFNDNPVLKR